jgi:quinoprotein glucose dehydrogenase
MSTSKLRVGSLPLLLLVALATCARPPALPTDRSGEDWAYYNGNPHGTHYSTLAEITHANVGRLQVAWEYDTGDAFGDAGAQSDMQANPLVVSGRMFVVSPKGRLICLNAATGELLWKYDPAEGRPVKTRQRLRGVSYWRSGDEERILFTSGRYLLAVDARNGQLIGSFGDNGRVNLREGLGRDPESVSVSNVTPGAIYRDLIIMGSTGSTPGHVRAYDVRTGKLRWIFHTIPQPGEYGYDTWPKDAWRTANGANVWAGMTVDTDSGIVFLPVASAGMAEKDFYGADRLGDDLFGTSLVALDANTGKRLWQFQLVRHDLWDRDPPTAPTLVTIHRNGRDIAALAQVTKAGLLYVLERRTGRPLFPVRDVPVPASDVPGETSAATQPMPIAPGPFARQKLTADLLTTRTPAAHAAVLKQFQQVSSRGPFDPPSLKGAILLPGMDGGAEWGGAAWDPETGLLYVNANEMAWTLRLKPRPPQIAGDRGRAIYANNCSACHGANRQGSGSEFPDLRAVADRLAFDDVTGIVGNGQGRMPSFGNRLTKAQIAAVANFVLTGRDEGRVENSPAAARQANAVRPDDAFVFDGYKRFLDPDGYPALKPPWGTLSAIDLNTGHYVWRQPLGEYPELAAQGLRNTGSENYGGAVVTRGGLLFIGATVFDNKFRAFDKRTGKLLWQTTLPHAGLATPATYSAGGRQFVAIAAGGGKNPKGKPGGKIVAFALPLK